MRRGAKEAPLAVEAAEAEAADEAAQAEAAAAEAEAAAAEAEWNSNDSKRESFRARVAVLANVVSRC